MRSKIEDALAVYLRSWGPLQWRDDLALPPAAVSSDVGRTLSALSAIETDSRVMYQKIQTAGLARHPCVKEFIFPWLAEEAEHGRALKALSRLYGEDSDPISRSDRPPTIHNIVAWPVLFAIRPAWRYFQAAYCLIGVAQEFIALTTYNYLSDLLTGYAGGNALKAMARQEGRHMSFYRSAAEEFLHSAKRVPLVARSALSRTWQPVGIDAIGVQAWWDAFGPLLADPLFRADLVKLDGMFDNILGMRGVGLVSAFLAEGEARILQYTAITHREEAPFTNLIA